jgi:hypothetical protein
MVALAIFKLFAPMIRSPLVKVNAPVMDIGEDNCTSPVLFISRLLKLIADPVGALIVAKLAPLKLTVPVPAEKFPNCVQLPDTFNDPLFIVSVAPVSIVRFFALTLFAFVFGCMATHVWFTGMITLVVLVGAAVAGTKFVPLYCDQFEIVA